MIRFRECGVLLCVAVVVSACQGGRVAESAAPVAGTSALFVAHQTAECGAANNIGAFAAGPDRLPGLSEVQRRGGLRVLEEFRAPTEQPSARDGHVHDWQGQAPRLGGLAVYDRGEHIYSDFLFDAWGADDGQDALRYGINEGLQQLYPRVERLDQLFQALGDQFGLPAPLGASSHYGDATDIRGPRDFTELRWAAGARGLSFYARLSRFTEDDQPVIAILFDLDPDVRADAPQLGLSDTRYDRLLLVQRDRAELVDLPSGVLLASDALSLQWFPEDFTNALELEIPWALLDGERDSVWLTVLSAQTDEDASDNDAATYIPANLAYRYDALDDGRSVVPCDPVAGIYNERAQAFDLYNGTIDGYAVALDVVGMRLGRSQRWQPTGGYYERIFQSHPSISHEDPLALGYADESDPFEPYEQTLEQPYGLYLPQNYDPQASYPLTLWLHYQGGMVHSAGAWSPRIVHQHGADNDSVVVTPRGRGSKSWYQGASHQDIWEVFADVAGTTLTGARGLPQDHAFAAEGLARIDRDRVYLSGYSMGGYGTYMFGLMYPDLFAAAYSTSGVHFGSALPGGAHLLENARHLPIVIHHGLIDELVPWVSIEPVALTLNQLGYRHRMDTLPAYEHYTQAITDEWAEGTRYLAAFKRNPSPRQVTYKIVPELVRTINNNRATLYGAGTRTQFDFRPDGAWWVDDIRVRDDAGCDVQAPAPCDDSVYALVDAVSLALPATLYSTAPPLLDSDNGLGLPSTPVVSPGNSVSPYLRQGLDWIDEQAAELQNRFELTLTNVAALNLDIEAMRLNLPQLAQGQVTTDGAVRLGLRGVPRTAQVRLNGQSTGQWASSLWLVDVPAGEHTLEILLP